MVSQAISRIVVDFPPHLCYFHFCKTIKATFAHSWQYIYQTHEQKSAKTEISIDCGWKSKVAGKSPATFHGGPCRKAYFMRKTGKPIQGFNSLVSGKKNPWKSRECDYLMMIMIFLNELPRECPNNYWFHLFIRWSKETNDRLLILGVVLAPWSQL